MTRPPVPESVLAAGAVLLLLGAVAGVFHDPPGNDGDGPAAPGATTVDIASFRFGPQELTVAVGDTVTWTNQDSAVHTVKGDDNIPTESERLAQGDTFDFTFADAGTFQYRCTIHQSMLGTVVVGGG